MTRAEAVALVKQYLGFRRSLDTTIVTQMQLQQKKLEQMPVKPWFLLSEKNYAFTTVDERRVTVPTDFLEEYEEGCLWYVPDDTDEEPVCLYKGDFDVLDGNFKEEEPGAPKAYSLDGDYFNIFPLPDDTYRLEMRYYKAAAVLSTADSENVWLEKFPDLLAGKTALAIAIGLRDTDAIKLCQSIVNENILLLNSQNEARKHSNTDMQMGGQH